MIRWYDYVIAFIVADFIQAFIFFGFNSDIWYNSLIFGGIAGYLYRTWIDVYCVLRKKIEDNNGKII